MHDKRTVVVLILGALGLIAILAGHTPPRADRAESVALPTARNQSMRWREVPPRDREGLDADLERLAEIGYVTGHTLATSAGGVSAHDIARAFDGLNLYISGHAPAAYLMDMRGEVRHEWNVDFATAFPGTDERVLRLDGVKYWRRAHLLENGGLLVIFDYLGLIRIDRDSNVIWALRHGFHHDLFVKDDRIYAIAERVGLVPDLGRQTKVREDFVTELDTAGNILREVSLVRAFQDSDFADVLDELPATDDIFHTNTIQVFDGTHADHSPVLADGLVLVSMRNINRIAILDLDQQAVVWHYAGGWKEQHDPVLLDTGNILIFDNNFGGTHSTVAEFDPADGHVLWKFEGTIDQTFYSERMGTNQRLPNGNTLIVESFAGRAIEVTPSNQIVWQFDNPARTGSDPELIAIMPDLIRVTAESVTPWLDR